MTHILLDTACLVPFKIPNCYFKRLQVYLKNKIKIWAASRINGINFSLLNPFDDAFFSFFSTSEGINIKELFVLFCWLNKISTSILHKIVLVCSCITVIVHHTQIWVLMHVVCEKRNCLTGFLIPNQCVEYLLSCLIAVLKYFALVACLDFFFHSASH